MKYLLSIIAVIALTGCSDKSNIDPSTTNSLDDAGINAAVIPRTIELANQTMSVVPHSEFVEWVNAHKTARIDSSFAF